MSEIWQLRRLSTGEPLTEPQELPENWGPIFGMRGFIDKIGDLGSWLGDAYADTGWIMIGHESISTTQSTSSLADLEWDRAKQMLRESDWAMLPDVPMTSGDKAKWIEYRRGLREIRLQAGFPNEISWPARPE